MYYIIIDDENNTRYSISIAPTKIRSNRLYIRIYILWCNLIIQVCTTYVTIVTRTTYILSRSTQSKCMLSPAPPQYLLQLRFTYHVMLDQNEIWIHHSDSQISLSYLMAVFSMKSFGLFYKYTRWYYLLPQRLRLFSDFRALCICIPKMCPQNQIFMQLPWPCCCSCGITSQKRDAYRSGLNWRSHKINDMIRLLFYSIFFILIAIYAKDLVNI